MEAETEAKMEKFNRYNRLKGHVAVHGVHTLSSDHASEFVEM